MYTCVSGPSASPPAIAPPTETPHSSRLEVANFPSEADKENDFGHLVAVVKELSAKGVSEPRFSTVFALWKERKPDAFKAVSAAQFEAYLQLAKSAGIITIEPQAGSRFRYLIETLNDLRLGGDPEPQFSLVGTRLLKNNPSIYKDTGVTAFGEYVRAATEAGVVTVHGVKNGNGSLKLCPTYCSPPACSPTPTGTTSTPATHTDSAPFTPLVEFLKSKQLTSSQPISFSAVVSHLFSTLGYPGLWSLCCGVPGVTSFGRYIDAAIDSGLISLVGGTTASGDALLSLRMGSQDDPSPPTQPMVSTTPLPSRPPPQETAVPPPPVNVTAKSFRDLVVVMTELRKETRKSIFRFPVVAPLLLERRPDAFTSVGVTEFRDYLALAVKHGIAKVWALDESEGCVALDDSEPERPSAPTQSSKSSEDGPPPPPVNPKGGGVDPKFVDLVEKLGELWKKGNKEPLLSHVGCELFGDARKRAAMLKACEASNFKACAELARNAGIVEICGQGTKQTMSLDPMIRVKAGYS